MVAELNKLFGLVSKSNMVQFKLKVQKRKETTPGTASEAPIEASQSKVTDSDMFKSSVGGEAPNAGGNQDQKLYDEFDKLKKRLQQL